MNTVIYFWQPYNKINGTLFYCYEYFEQLNRMNKSKFIIVYNDMLETDKNLVTEAFLDKYRYVLTNDIIFIPRIKLYSTLKKYNIEKILYLDTESYIRTNELTGIKQSNMYLYVDNKKDYTKKELKCNTYGWNTEYQLFDTYEQLKLNFKIFKKIKESGHYTFVSSPITSNRRITSNTSSGNILKEIKNNFKIIEKRTDKIKGNLFSYIERVVYIHTALDTNNRILPEAFYYNKEVIVIDEKKDIVDSINDRYTNLLDDNISKYTLTENSKIIQDIIKGKK